METILEMIRHVVIFLLIAALIGNLFIGTEYRKYFSYATSLIVVVMVLVPLVQVLGRDKDWTDYLVRADYRQQAEQTKKEIRLLGEKYEENVRKQYEDQLKEAIAGQCGTEKECCELRMKGLKIQFIRVRVKKMPARVSAIVSSLAVCYGVEEKNIFIEEEEG